MSGLSKRDVKQLERIGMFDRFDQMFDDRMKMLPFRRTVGNGAGWPSSEHPIRVDELHEDGRAPRWRP